MPENHKQAEEALRRSRDAATAINRLLSLSLENISLQEFLEKAVELILSIPWLVFKAKGSIFLLENGSLVLKAQNGLEETVKKECARLPLGRCLCGRAALTGEVQYAAGIDKRHEIYFEEMEPHGHYCVPIKSPEKIYGALNLYLHEGHRRDEKEEEFLVAVSDALAGVIEHKQAEEALRKSEKKFRAIFDSSQDAMYLHDLEGKIIAVNKAACERLGYSSGELEGKFLTDIVSPKDAALIAERMEKLLATGRHTFETTDVSKDGKVIPVEVSATIIGDESARAVLSASRDITVRKKAEEKIRTLNEELEQRVEERTAALRESEERLKKITDNVTDAVALCNIEGNVTYLSPQSHRVLGFSPEELLGKPIFTIVYEEDLPAIIQQFNDSLEAKEPSSAEYRIATKDGRLVWVETRGDLLYENGQVSGAVFVTRDITERKQLEEQINESRKMYKSVVDTQQEMICRYLPDTTLTFVNDAYCRVFGKSRSELLGQKFLMFLPPEVHEKEIESLNSLTPANPNVTKEFGVLLSDGSTAWQEWTDQALSDENGQVIEIQGVGRDITRRKQAEIESLHQARRAEALLKVSSRLNAELEPDRVRNAICEETCSALHTQMAAYLYYSNNDRCFHLAASVGLPIELARASEPLGWEKVNLLFAKLGKAGAIPDLATVPELPYAQTMLSHGIQSIAYSLIERQDLPLGILVTGADEKVDFTGDPLSLLSGLADQAASAVTNARLLQETKDRLRQVQALRNIDLAITGSLDLRVTFQVVLDEVTGMLNTDAAAILLLDPYSNTLRYEQWRGFHSKDLKNVTLPQGKGYCGRAAAERQTIHIADLSKAEQDPVQGPLLVREGFAVYFAVPLIAKGTVRGVLEVYHREPVETDGDWLAFLETLAGQAAIAVDNAELFSRLERTSVDLLQAYDATIEGWAHALDLKDEETEGHSRRVTELTVNIAREMGVKQEELAHVRRGALLHDIGKMGIPDSILLKPGKLTEEEWEVMRKHPVYAYEMLAPVDYLQPALDIPYCHHEKWDGNGYPRGLKGKAIPLSARIFAVVDVYDALTSDRPYRKAWGKEKTLTLIKEESGKHFDPEVVEVFLQELV